MFGMPSCSSVPAQRRRLGVPCFSKASTRYFGGPVPFSTRCGFSCIGTGQAWHVFWTPQEAIDDLGTSQWRRSERSARPEEIRVLLTRPSKSLSANLESTRRDLQQAEGEVATLQAELAKREETIEAERQELRRVQGTMTALQAELAEREQALRLLLAPQVRLVRLTDLEPSPGAASQLLWNAAAYTGVLLTSGLPQLSRDRIYELWAIAGSEPIPAGIFAVDERGHAVLHLP